MRYRRTANLANGIARLLVEFVALQRIAMFGVDVVSGANECFLACLFRVCCVENAVDGAVSMNGRRVMLYRPPRSSL